MSVVGLEVIRREPVGGLFLARRGRCRMDVVWQRPDDLSLRPDAPCRFSGLRLLYDLRPCAGNFSCRSSNAGPLPPRVLRPFDTSQSLTCGSHRG